MSAQRKLVVSVCLPTNSVSLFLELILSDIFSILVYITSLVVHDFVLLDPAIYSLFRVDKFRI